MTLEYIPSNFTEQEFFKKILKKSDSGRSVIAGESHVRKFKIFCMDEYKMEASMLCRQLAADHRETRNPMKVLRVMQTFVDWCEVDHPGLFTYSGYKKSCVKPVKKIHPNTIQGVFSCVKKYMAQVGGIRIDDTDINMHVTLPQRVDTDDEDAEPITYEMAKALLEQLKSHIHLVTACHGSNSTGFRWREWALTQEKNIDFTKKPPTVTLEKYKSKAKLSKGERYMLPDCATRIKNLLTGNPENYFMLTAVESLKMQDPEVLDVVKDKIIGNYEIRCNKSFRRACRKLDEAREEPFFTAKYPENGRYKINLHSWRKKCGTDYAEANHEDMAHGYLRHKRYLSMYTLKKEPQRIEAFQKAAPILALDKDEQTKVALVAAGLENDKLKEEKRGTEDLLSLVNSPEFIDALKFVRLQKK